MNRRDPFLHPDDQLIGARQALELLGLPPTSRATLLRAVESGEIRAASSTPGGHRRYLRSEILRYRDELIRRVQKTGAPPTPDLHVLGE